MTRYYDAGHHFTDSEFGYGIGCAYPTFLRRFYYNDKEFIGIEMRQGMEILFELKQVKGKNELVGRVAKEYFKTGYTNCCEALLRGEPSLYAMEVILYNDKAIVSLGDGSKRRYQFSFSTMNEIFYILNLEEKSNGNKIHFSYYDAPIRLKEIQTTNKEKKVLNWLQFKYNFKKSQLTVEGSDGQKVDYFTEEKKGKVKKGNLLRGYTAKPRYDVLSKVSLNGTPHTRYEVENRTKSLATIFSVKKILMPNGRFLEVDYDSHQKVKALYSSGISKPLYTFEYHTDYTSVTNALGGTSHFDFSKRRLIKYSDDVRTQKYEWDEKGQLTSHIIQDKKGIEISRRNYTYDDQGNILKIEVKGSITDKNAKDCYTTLYTYSKDGYNRLLQEEHNGKLKKTYLYDPVTHELSSKLTYSDNQIEEREFFKYDSNAILIQKVVDDGSSGDRDNLSSVTYRLITDIEPQLDSNEKGLSFPKIIKESYLDLSTGETHLLKKVERFYTKGNLLAEEKVFDANDSYRHSKFYEYNDRLEKIKEVNEVGETTLFAYDDNGNKIFEEKVNSGKKVYFTYDLANRLVEEKEEHVDKTLITKHEYDALDNKISITDIYGKKTSFKYDTCSRETAQTDPLGKSELKKYDSEGNLVEFRDKDGFVTTTLHNLYGDPLEVHYPDGSSKKYSYNLEGDLISEVERDGILIKYTRDYKGRITKTETYDTQNILLKTTSKEYKGLNLTAEVDAMRGTTLYSYDCAGRQIAKRQDPVVTTYSYDSLGRLQKTSIGNHIEIKEYDSLNRVIEERIENDSQIFKKITYTYDIHGNISTKTVFSDPAQPFESTTLHNSQGLPILEVDPLGNQTKTTYRQTDHLEKETQDPLGRCTIEIYDSLNRLSEVKLVSPASTLLAQRNFSYDGRGNQTKHQEKTFFENGNYTTKTSYDSMSQKVALEEQGVRRTTWSYTQGKLKDIALPSGIVLTHSYDSLGRLQELISSEGTIHYHYTYDLNDNLLQVDDLYHHTQTVRSYDALNRMIYEKQASGLEFSFSYDFLNRLQEVTFLDRLIRFSYSPTNLLNASVYKKGQFLYTYSQECDWRGKVIEASFPNQTKQFLHWDGNGKCKKIESPSFRLALSYDPVGNLVKTTQEDSQGSFESTYCYDCLYQLNEERGPFTNSYEYDAIFNRHKKNENTLQIDHLNQLTHDGNNHYSYDLNGRRISKGSTNYSYDPLGRLISVQNGHDISTFSYDPFGRRIKSNEISHLYIDGTEVGAYKDKLIEFRLTHKNQTLAIELDNDTYTPIRNHRGDICQLLDQNGKPVSNTRYDAFGLNETQGLNSPWLFSGQRYDENLQLYHFEKRAYDPFQGRWLTPDPLGYVDGPNLYAYVHNNPLIFVDPYGLWKEETKDFFHSASRGFLDDSTWNTSRHAFGTHQPHSRAGRVGYQIGTGLSMAAGMFYGATELKAARGIYTGAKKLLSASTATRATKNLHQSHQISHLSKEAANANPVNKMAQTITKSTFNPKAIKTESKIANTNQQKIHKAINAIEHFLGGKGKVITNADNDMILMRSNKKIRFDINNSHGDKAHFHLEKQMPSGKWTDATSEHRYYFKEEY